MARSCRSCSTTIASSLLPAFAARLAPQSRPLHGRRRRLARRPSVARRSGDRRVPWSAVQCLRPAVRALPRRPATVDSRDRFRRRAALHGVPHHAAHRFARAPRRRRRRRGRRRPRTSGRWERRRRSEPRRRRIQQHDGEPAPHPRRAVATAGARGRGRVCRVAGARNPQRPDRRSRGPAARGRKGGTATRQRGR